jgi:hypothetical protein
MASIGSLKRPAAPPPKIAKTRETVSISVLPKADGTGWGRDCVVKRLNPLEQVTLLGAVRDAVLNDRKRRAEGDPDAPIDDQASNEQWESIYLLMMGVVEPSFDLAEATIWFTSDTVKIGDGPDAVEVPTDDVVQPLLYHVRSLNEEQPGLEDVAGGLSTVRKMPLALQNLENAFLQGPEAFQMLLDGKVPESQQEMAQFIERWGAIIGAVAFGVLKKQAVVMADANAEAMLKKFTDFALEIGALKREQR